MKEKYIKRIIFLSIITFLAFFALFCSKESRESKEKPSQQVSSEETYVSEESLLLKREISQKIVETNNHFPGSLDVTRTAYTYSYGNH